MKAIPSISVTMISAGPPSRSMRWIDGTDISSARHGPTVPPFWHTYSSPSLPDDAAVRPAGGVGVPADARRLVPHGDLAAERLDEADPAVGQDRRPLRPAQPVSQQCRFHVTTSRSRTLGERSARWTRTVVSSPIVARSSHGAGGDAADDVALDEQLAISSGTIVTTPTVAAMFQSIGRWALISPAAPIGIVFWSSELIRYRPTRNSFQMKMLEKIAATRIPGRTSGSSTRRSVPPRAAAVERPPRRRARAGSRRRSRS